VQPATSQACLLQAPDVVADRECIDIPIHTGEASDDLVPEDQR